MDGQRINDIMITTSKREIAAMQKLDTLIILFIYADLGDLKNLSMKQWKL